MQNINPGPGAIWSNIRDMPALIYDADCGFCTTSAMWLAKRGKFETQAWQFHENLEDLGLDFDAVTSASHWVVDGRVVASGAEAIGEALKQRGGVARILGGITNARPVRPIARVVYSRIAKNRHLMPGGTAACKVPTR